MARHYSTKDFFRQMPNALLSRYFRQRSLFQQINFVTMKENKPDELFETWLELPKIDRNTIDAEFRDIFEMSCEKGFIAILDEARCQMRENLEILFEFIKMLSALPNHYYRAMTVYLDHSECWKGAIRFYHADTLTYWRKRKHLGHKPSSLDEASLQQLGQMIRNYFHHTEGRGNNCIVEAFRRNDLDYFFAYPEDYSQQSVEWVNDEFGRRPHNPAFEIIYVYSQQEGTLDLNFQGSYKAVEPLQNIFASAILKLDELPPNPKDSRVYDLNPLRQRSFSFVYPPNSGIDFVAVKKLRFSSRINQGDRITLEADVIQNPYGIYLQIDDINNSIPLHLFNITQVELTVQSSEIGKPRKTTTIRISYPNSCSLKYDPLDLKLRNMLEASGIEPKEPSEEFEVMEADGT